MAKVKAQNPSGSSRKMRPALTPEAKENQMISLAMDLVEQRLRDGTASSQETTHFLKLATAKSKLELIALERQNELMEAKKEALQSNKRMEDLYNEAIKAMATYSGHGEPYEDPDIF